MIIRFHGAAADGWCISSRSKSITSWLPNESLGIGSSLSQVFFSSYQREAKRFCICSRFAIKYQFVISDSQKMWSERKRNDGSGSPRACEKFFVIHLSVVAWWIIEQALQWRFWCLHRRVHSSKTRFSESRGCKRNLADWIKLTQIMVVFLLFQILRSCECLGSPMSLNAPEKLFAWVDETRKKLRRNMFARRSDIVSAS